MSNDGELYPDTTERFATVASNYYQAEEAFFQAAYNLAQKPKQARFADVQEAVDMLHESIEDYTGSLLEDDRYSTKEKARSIATILTEADMRRVASLKNIAPKGKYEYSEATVDDFTELVEDLIEESQESIDQHPSEIILSTYLGGLQIDISELVDTVSTSSEMKRLKRNLALRKNASEVGKLVVGGILGGIVAASLVERHTRRR